MREKQAPRGSTRALLLLATLAVGACGSDPPPPPAAEVKICAEVTDDFRCRMPARTIAPNLPYAFLVEGPPFPSRDIVVQLVRLDTGRPSTIARQRDRVEADANVYSSTISVAQPGIYRLEIWSGRDVFAAVQFEATRRPTTAPTKVADGPGGAPSTDPNRERIVVSCGADCERLVAEANRLHAHCVGDPMGEVRQVMTGRMVVLGCCGWAGGVYERSCSLAGPMRECLDQWTTACTEASRTARAP